MKVRSIRKSDNAALARKRAVIRALIEQTLQNEPAERLTRLEPSPGKIIPFPVAVR